MTMPNGTLLEVLRKQEDGWWLLRVVPTGQEGWALSGSKNQSWIDCCIQSSQPIKDAGGNGFRTPSNNIYCLLDDYGVQSNSYPPYLRCDIQKFDNRPPPKPKICEGDWGQAFGIDSDDAAGFRMCHTDTVINDQWPILSYGSVWQQQGFTCLSEQNGLTCFNAKRHGFTLSRGDQKLF